MAEDMPTFPGLDRWHLLCHIGKGAFSEVFRAQDTQASHDEVAIKIMRKREMNSQQVRFVLSSCLFKQTGSSNQRAEHQHVQRN